MKALIAYYSFTGKTKALCERFKTDECDLYEIKETKKRGTINAYTLGCYKAIKGIASNIQPINVDVNKYELIIIACPIWAGTFAPAAISFLKKASLKNKSIIAIANSSSGADCSQKIKELLSGVGAKCINVYNVKNGKDIEVSELSS